MRTATLWTIILVTASAAQSWAFHQPGRSECGACHISSSDQIPDSDESNARFENEPARNPHMLKEQTPSDVCLSCHATDNGEVLSQSPTNPGPEKGAGNFVFLMEDNLNDTETGSDTANWIPGDAAGHNLNAPEFGISTDMTLQHAPGGVFPSEIMSCTSCHDPHGNDNFRLLYGAGPVQNEAFTFVNPAPDAEGISLSVGSESDGLHSAYKSGMSQWCANCHSDFHNTNYPSVMRHPSGSELGVAIANSYNAYNGTSDPTGGTDGSAYLALVPFEDDDPLNTIYSTHGPTASSKVMCLSCHRAHASSAPDAGRWDFNVTYIGSDGQKSGSHALPNPFGIDQRSLCNKCHVKDGARTIQQDRLASTDD